MDEIPNLFIRDLDCTAIPVLNPELPSKFIAGGVLVSTEDKTRQVRLSEVYTAPDLFSYLNYALAKYNSECFLIKSERTGEVAQVTRSDFGL